MTDDEKAGFVAAAMKDAAVKSATGTPSQRKKAYRMAIWNAIENRISDAEHDAAKEASERA